jgi:predicted RNA binding protein YcfA (HicA-like mRNA interferase family)
MPKVPSLTPQQLTKILEQRGYILDRSKGSHRIYIHQGTNKRVVVPFHRKDMPKGTLLEILKQAGISPDEV